MAIESLRTRHEALLSANPGMRIRERARQLGVSEGELVALQLGVSAVPLRCEPAGIFPKLGSLGRIMCLTRNEWAVHERYGQFEQVDVFDKMGLVLGNDIDLRLFFSHWQHVWEVNDKGRISLQFFDKTGLALHKIFRTDETDAAAWEALVAEFRLPDGAQNAVVFEPAVVKPRDHGAELDADTQRALREGWLAMTDPHEFIPMLRKMKLSRITAVAAVGADLAQQVDRLAIEKVLQHASDTGLPIMVFAGNHGAVQIHGGTVKKLVRTGPWYNVLDPAFNLHVNTDAVVSSWVVNRPTSDGPVTSLELYADDGELIVQFFGLRKPGNPELPAWRALMTSLCAQPLHGG
ncbi:MAG: ChuX/HutX family heme-like substrate-binding protein [Lautropia sp.]|nr:ChuX/HutX family heme-like substrate-binding protein [Lautropia sp.]